MNIRQYFINKLQQKQNPIIKINDEDIIFIKDYLAPMQAFLGDDYSQLCHGIFTIFKNQLSVYYHDQTACQNAFFQAASEVQEKHPISMDRDAMSKADSPEAKAAIEAFKSNPAITNYYMVLILSQLLTKHPAQMGAITKDKKVPLKVSQWLTNIIATKSTQGHEELAGLCSDLSFEAFSKSFQIHSEIPALLEFFEMDLEEDYNGINNGLFLIPETSFAEFKTGIINVYQDIEKAHYDYSKPLLEEAYTAYLHVVDILSKHLTKGPTPHSLVSGEHAFSHLPKDEASVSSLGDFQKVVIEASKQKPVLVDFWATWCEPCKRLSPIIDDIQASQSAMLSVVKIDVDKASDIARNEGVKSMPTLVLYYQGKEIGRISGFKPKDQILAFISESLSKEASPQ